MKATQQYIQKGLKAVVAACAFLSVAGAADEGALITIKRDKPATLSEIQDPYTAKNVLEKAYNHDDLNGLIDAAGIRQCADLNGQHNQDFWMSSSRRPSCFKQDLVRRDVALDYATAKKERDEGWVSPRYKWEEMTPKKVQSDAANRAMYRMVSDFFAKNEAISLILSGKFTFDFSIAEVFGGSQRKKVNASSDVKPAYMIRKKKRTESANARSQGILVASTDANKHSLFFKDSSPKFGAGSDDDELMFDKELVEVWPEPNRPASSVYVSAEEMSAGDRLAKRMGWAAPGLTRYRLKAERVGNGFGRENIKLRVEEGANIVFADVSGLVNGKGKKTIQWGVQLPYHEHAVGVEYPHLGAKPTSFYRYYINDQQNIRLAYVSQEKLIQLGLNSQF